MRRRRWHHLSKSATWPASRTEERQRLGDSVAPLIRRVPERAGPHHLDPARRGSLMSSKAALHEGLEGIHSEGIRRPGFIAQHRGTGRSATPSRRRTRTSSGRSQRGPGLRYLGSRAGETPVSSSEDLPGRTGSSPPDGVMMSRLHHQLE